jgi:hypothetical protein
MSNDETQPAGPAPSGSLWEEPAAHPPPVGPPPAAPAHNTPAYAAARTPPRRGRLLLAGGAVGVALVAGTGGYAVGQLTAGDGRDDRGLFDRTGYFPGGAQQNFPEGGPPGAFPGQGGQGMPGPPPGWQDRRDDDETLPDDGATQGSAEGSSTT